MTPVDAAVVRRKLGVIVRGLEGLAPAAELSRAEYAKDLLRRKGVERLLQELVEAASDVNLHLLTADGAKPPSGYYESFVALGRAGVIDRALAEALAPAAGLRNRLVHQYDEIDDEIVLGAVTEARRLFPAYVAAVERHLTRAGL